MISNEEGRLLVKLARDVINYHVKNKDAEIKKLSEYPACFKEKRGVFCTLTIKGELRGCIGIPYPVMPLLNALMDSAKSVCCDPRFQVLHESELEKIKIEVSVLTEPEKIEATNPDEMLKKIKPREDGIIIKYGVPSALFLPQVWEQLPDKEEFLRNLCIKAGLYPDTWKDPKTNVFKFHVQVFGEE